MAWQDNVKAIAPTLGGLLTAFGGPAGALAGAALGAVASALGVQNTPDAVAAAMQVGLTPEQKANLLAADMEYKKAVLQTGLEEKRIAADTEKSYIEDVADARAHNANTVGILRLGYMINACSYIVVLAVLIGCYRFVTGGKLDIDAGAAAMVGGIVGAALQWVISNSAQANGFFFGSSPTARANSTALAASVSNTAAKLPTEKKP